MADRLLQGMDGAISSAKYWQKIEGKE